MLATGVNVQRRKKAGPLTLSRTEPACEALSTWDNDCVFSNSVVCLVSMFREHPQGLSGLDKSNVKQKGKESFLPKYEEASTVLERR